MSCGCFEKIPFPMYLFNPLSKDEFLSREPCILPWPGPRGPVGPPGPQGPPGPGGGSMPFVDWEEENKQSPNYIQNRPVVNGSVFVGNWEIADTPITNLEIAGLFV